MNELKADTLLKEILGIYSQLEDKCVRIIIFAIT